MNAITPVFIPIVTDGSDNVHLNVPTWAFVVAVISFFVFLPMIIRYMREEFGLLDAMDFAGAVVIAVLFSILWPATYFISALWYVYKNYVVKDDE